MSDACSVCGGRGVLDVGYRGDAMTTAIYQTVCGACRGAGVMGEVDKLRVELAATQQRLLAAERREAEAMESYFSERGRAVGAERREAQLREENACLRSDVQKLLAQLGIYAMAEETAGG